jgi:hypothetical protein
MSELHCPSCGTALVAAASPDGRAAPSPPPEAGWDAVRSGLLLLCWGMAVHLVGEAVGVAYLLLAAAADGHMHGAVFADGAVSLGRQVGGALALAGVGLCCLAPRHTGAARSARWTVAGFLAALALVVAAALRPPAPALLAGAAVASAAGAFFFSLTLRNTAHFFDSRRLGRSLSVDFFVAWVVALAATYVLQFVRLSPEPPAGITAREWAAVGVLAAVLVFYAWLAVLLLRLRRRVPIAPASAAPRFSWPMRIFLTVMVFEIVFRSASVLVPWKDWESSLRMDEECVPDENVPGRGEYVTRRFPRALPTRAEAARLAERPSPDNPFPVADRVGQSLDSLARFLSPAPTEKVIRESNSTDDLGKFVVVWINRRLSLAENLVGFEQRWEMFSPGASKQKDLTRARLVFEDGSEEVVHQDCDPEDLLCYFRWNFEKVGDYEMQAKDDGGHKEECVGYCNVVAHQHPRNAAGSPLKKIYLFRIHYDYPPPDVDARAWLAERNGPPRYVVHEDPIRAAAAVGLAAPSPGANPLASVPLFGETGWIKPDFFEYDPSDGAGQFVN